MAASKNPGWIPPLPSPGSRSRAGQTQARALPPDPPPPEQGQARHTSAQQQELPGLRDEADLHDTDQREIAVRRALEAARAESEAEIRFATGYRIMRN